mgnify:CR=1 FL=1
MKRSMRVFLDTLKKSRAVIAAIGLCFIGAGAVFYLYHLPLEPFAYVALLIVFIGLAAFLVAFGKALAQARTRERLLRAALTREELPPAVTLAEEDYAAVITMLRNELTALKNEYATARQDEIDYYTAWVHQIKTPIAVMRMELGGTQTENARALESELFRIEQYVDMVLTFIRLGSDGNDLVIREYPLDELIRETVRKFASQFVGKRLYLHYDGAAGEIVTDKKWFSCILEQIVSNAIKYTHAGGITITVEDGVLTVSDTGIGIAPEDIPRIFEKGYTGENGRLDKRSSGLGLYLCKKAADLLCIPLAVESTVERGSAFSMDLGGKLKR